MSLQERECDDRVEMILDYVVALVSGPGQDENVKSAKLVFPVPALAFL